ncbi:SSI family serine proteinase inhibitor [Streptomyces litmocidini]|uniref:SSI family serine proteinase inhibitor n=1 Tax=Streptomyces litmocidini TaxID=67318 RepID=A0ABW7U4Z1_9ACTN|nr:SSI family serine proteinase inhibitor [Streptomyces sp. PanSC19]ROQ33213.1 subtilisin inhibitor-like [Streptomyces sp. PanSC19]
MLRSLVLATLATAAVGTTGLGPLPLPAPFSSPDTLTVTVERSGDPRADGTFRLSCGDRAEGDHPAAEEACGRLGQLGREGGDPFLPVPQDQMCTQVYGGPAAAHVTGVWRGREVDARFSRANGCEIDRWENLEPFLPIVRG